MALVSCGRNNESGRRSNSWDFGNPYVNGQLPFTGINSPYAFNGTSVNQVIQQNPCINQFGGVPGFSGQPYNGQRIPLQIPMLNFPTVIAPNDVYVGVTSFGDVAVLAGQGANQPPLFVAYMCPRSFSPSGQGQLLGVKIGSYTNCLFKPITAATMILPGGGTAEFRWLDGGSSMRTPFSFCRRGF